MDFNFEEDDRKVDAPKAIPRSKSVVFDIEPSPVWTPGESLEAAREYCLPLGIEFDPDSIGQHPGEFDPKSVKLGNLKDYGKIEAKIESARQKHGAAVEKFNHDKEFEEHIFWHAVVDNAALSPVTGMALAIGYLKDGELAILLCDRRRSPLEHRATARCPPLERRTSIFITLCRLGFR